MSDGFGWFGNHTLCRQVSLAILSISLWVLAGPVAAAQTNAKNVLVLFSFSSQRSDLDLVENSLQKHFSGYVNFYSAYVYGDYEQIAGGTPYLDSLAETLRQGYKNVKLDVIVVAAPDALRFVIQYRNMIFPGVPIVFYGLSQNELAGLKLLAGDDGQNRIFRYSGDD